MSEEDGNIPPPLPQKHRDSNDSAPLIAENVSFLYSNRSSVTKCFLNLNLLENDGCNDKDIPSPPPLPPPKPPKTKKSSS